MVASGIRVGTPSVTTQGMREGGDAPDRGADRAGGPRPIRPPPAARDLLAEVAAEVAELVAAFPAYPRDPAERRGGPVRRPERPIRRDRLPTTAGAPARVGRGAALPARTLAVELRHLPVLLGASAACWSSRR